MVKSNKVKVVKRHCKRLDEQIQEIHQELLESATVNEARWLEHDRKFDEISSKIEILTNQIQSFLTNQMEIREVRTNARGILPNPETRRELEQLAYKKAHED
uniref:Uncharacterized protein n=1 Tax=Populus alba TaxID=43335 RepID=A0A4U5Q7F9_POPAL|nr:hypothetical protein D5086_0000126780 [Populus alba]